MRKHGNTKKNHVFLVLFASCFATQNQLPLLKGWGTGGTLTFLSISPVDDLHCGRKCLFSPWGLLNSWSWYHCPSCFDSKSEALFTYSTRDKATYLYPTIFSYIQRGAVGKWLEWLGYGAESRHTAQVRGWVSPCNDWKTLSVNPTVNGYLFEL